MKTSILIFTIGLILIAASITLILLDPNSGRTLSISGLLTFFGFPLTIAGFALKESKPRLTER
jgi:hypothetical protein